MLCHCKDLCCCRSYCLTCQYRLPYQSLMLISLLNGNKVLSVGFPYFTNIVQLLCSLSGWLHLNCSSIGTGFNGAETNSRIAHNLSILLMNSNCFAIVFSSILVTSVQIYISVSDQFSLPEEQCLQLSHQLTALCRPWDNNPSC